MINKAKMVRKIFTSVAGKYDLMNDIMSFGIHHLWKKKLIGKINVNPKSRIIDVAGGTGDIAIRICKDYKDASIWVCDNNLAMLEKGRNHSFDLGILNQIRWICSEAEKLPFSGNTFDIYTISFGLRNTYDINGALAEAFRVLKAGGTFACLEFSPDIQGKCFKKAYVFYLSQIIPKLGKKITGDYDAYQYLSDSILNFHKPEAVKSMLEACGFQCLTITKLFNGVATIFLAQKPL